jgi:hypothetical protein
MLSRATIAAATCPRPIAASASSGETICNLIDALCAVAFAGSSGEHRVVVVEGAAAARIERMTFAECARARQRDCWR